MRSIRTSAQVQPQSTRQIMMIRPSSFGFNQETAGSNEFQNSPAGGEAGLARGEFENMVVQLRAAGVDVSLFDDTVSPVKPDAVFSNNWVSFHQSGKVVLYPMMAANRRAERRTDIVDALAGRFHVEEIVDLTHFEAEGKFLEGTGSMVFDRRYKIAYACLSPRTHPEVLTAFSDALGYELVTFHAVGKNGVPVYHTNVMMCVGDIFAVVCLDSLADADERYHLRAVLEETGKQIIEISIDQMEHFAGNMLLVRAANDEKILVMSDAAYRSLSDGQKDALDDYARLFPVELANLERIGGGSARCMLTEIHLPFK